MATYADPVTPMRLALHRWGRGRRRALLVHGLTSSGATWWRLAEALADHDVSVRAPDLRGHGSSPRAGRYAVADHAADVGALGDEWDLVVGHSLGAAIALQLAVEAARPPAQMLLLDPVLELTDRERDLLAATCVAEVLDGRTTRDVQDEHPGWHPLDARLKARAARQTTPAIVRRTIDDNRPWDFRSLALAVPCPTLILGADPRAGALFSPALGRELCAEQPALRYRMVPGAGHSIQRDDPAAVAHAAEALLAAA